MNCVWCTWDVTPGTLLLSAAVQSERLWRCSQRPCGEHPASWMVTQLKRELGVWWRRPVHQQHLPKNTPSSERESFCLKGTVHLKNTSTCSVIYPSKLFCCEFRVVCPLSLWCSKSYSNAFEKNSTTMSPSKNLERSLKITCRPCCEPEQMKEQFIQKNQECLFPSLPQFLEIVLMWVLQISALKMSASSQMWYHQICSVFILLVLRGFVSLCFSLLPTNFHPDHGGGEGQAQEEASGQGGVGGELQRPELGDLLSVTWRHAALEPAQTPSHEALQVSLRRRAGPGREGRHPHCRYDVSHGKKTEAEVSVRGMYVSAHYSSLCSALVLILKTPLYHCC